MPSSNFFRPRVMVRARPRVVKIRIVVDEDMEKKDIEGMIVKAVKRLPGIRGAERC